MTNYDNANNGANGKSSLANAGQSTLNGNADK